MVILLGLLSLLIGTIIVLFNFVYVEGDGLYEKYGLIGEVSVYKLENEDEHTINSLYEYDVLFESSEVIYTSQDNTGYIYYVFYQDEFLSLSEAYQLGLFTLEDLENFSFDVSITKRYKLFQKEDVIQVSIIDDSLSAPDSEDVINNGYDMNEFIRTFNTYMFKERLDTEINPLYQIQFELEDQIVEVAVTMEGFIELSTNRISLFEENNSGEDSTTIEAYFKE